MLSALCVSGTNLGRFVFDLTTSANRFSLVYPPKIGDFRASHGCLGQSLRPNKYYLCDHSQSLQEAPSLLIGVFSVLVTLYTAQDYA